MYKESRTKNVSKSITISIIFFILNLFLNFVIRTLFVRKLGVELLGINSIFTNIITVISLAELGFSNAIMYSLYLPLANDNREKISAIINYYKKIYRIIAIVVFIIGISAIPFLGIIINTEINIEYSTLIIYYILFLLSTVMSYLWSYTSVLLIADQKIYKHKFFVFCGFLVQFLAQCISLIIFQNYIMYLIIPIFTTAFTNIIIYLYVNKKYPYVTNCTLLPKQEKICIRENVKHIFIYKISSVILNNTDNIIISIIMGTSLVGYYSNYSMVVSALMGIINVFFTSFSPSIGNLISENNSDKQHKTYKEMQLIAVIISIFSAIQFVTLIDSFVELWLGDTFILDYKSVIAMALNLYIVTMQNPVLVYRDTTGIFKEAKNVSIILAILNLMLSVVLIKIMGLFGILIAKVISRLFTSYWYQPYILYKQKFKSKFKEYIYLNINSIFVLVLSYFILFFIDKLFIDKIFIDVTLMKFIIKAIINSIIVLIILYISYRKNDEFKSILNKVMVLINRNKHEYGANN